MNSLYNFGIKAYRTGAKLVARRNVKASKMISGQNETFERLKEKINKSDKYIWFHAASLGEFEQGRPLIEKIKRESPEFKILLTFFSPSGYEVRCNYPMADVVCYLPFDTSANARRFVDLVNPVAAVFIKYEFWGNYLQALRRKGIPTFLISSIFRPSQSFFKWWGGMFRGMLRCYSHIFVQDESSRKLLGSIDVDNVTVCGDTRFDRVTDVMRATRHIEGMDEFRNDSPVTMIVGSSWEADEDVYIPWLKQHPEVKAVIAPHEFNAERLAALKERLGCGAVLLSEIDNHTVSPHDCRYVIVDSFGLLSSLYRYGDVAYVGGGFGAGIHNLNEAAVYGIPVIFGPNNAKFKEAQDLKACGGGIEVDGQEKFNEVMDMLCNADERGRRGKLAGGYIASHIGATDRIYSHIAPLFNSAEKHR